VGFSEIPVYSMIEDPTFNPRMLRRKFERTQRLAEFIDKLRLPRGSLVYVDPLGLFLGGNLVDYDACAVACHEIRAVLRERGLLMLATTHTSKIKADQAARYLRMEDQILGSTALAGFSDTLMYLAAPEEVDRECYVLLIHPHMLKAQTFELQRDDNGLFVPYHGDAMTSAASRVLAVLPTDGALVPVEQVCELATPMTVRTARRALQALVQAQLAERPVRGLYRRKPAH